MDEEMPEQMEGMGDDFDALSSGAKRCMRSREIRLFTCDIDAFAHICSSKGHK